MTNDGSETPDALTGPAQEAARAAGRAIRERLSAADARTTTLEDLIDDLRWRIYRIELTLNLDDPIAPLPDPEAAD